MFEEVVVTAWFMRLPSLFTFPASGSTVHAVPWAVVPEVSVSFLSLHCPCVHRVSELCCCYPLAAAAAHRSFSSAAVQIRARCCSQLFPDWSPCFPRCFSSQLVVYPKWNLTVFLSLKPLRTPVRSKSKVLNIIVITNLYSSFKTKTESPLGVPDYPTTGDCFSVQ